MDDNIKTLLIACIPFIFNLILTQLQKRKDEAAIQRDASEASEKITDSALKLVEPLNKEIDKLKARITELEKAVEDLEARDHKWSVGCKKLTKQLIDAGMNPRWSPVGIIK